ncbi:beta strand repeat-containing protein [Pseudomonadota bacterium]
MRVKLSLKSKNQRSFTYAWGVISYVFTLLLLGVQPTFAAGSFSQTNWGWGVIGDEGTCTAYTGTWVSSTCYASNTNNQSGWQAYDSKDANLSLINANSDLELAMNSNQIIHKSSQDFSNGVVSSVNIKGSKLSLEALSRTVAWSFFYTVPYAWNDDPYPAAGDFNKDGLMDFVTGNRWGYTAYGYKNQGDGTWAYDSSFNFEDNHGTAGTVYADVGDFDGDGDPDVLVENRSRGTKVMYRNDTPDGGATNPTRTDISSTWGTPSAWYWSFGDLDGDDLADGMSGCSGASCGLTAYKNIFTTKPTFTTPMTGWNGPWIGWQPNNITLDDIDGDGDPDMKSGGSVWENQSDGVGGDITWVSSNAWSPSSAITGFQDFDGDELPDAYIQRGDHKIDVYKNAGILDYPASGTFTSEVLDFASHSGFTTLDFSETEYGGSTLTMEVRAGDDVAAPGTWAVQWTTVNASGDSIAALGTHRYAQYKVTLNAGHDGRTETTPTLRDITFNYDQVSSPHLTTSNWFNTEAANNYMWPFGWTESLLATTDVQIQMRTAPDSTGSPGAATDWFGPDGTNSTYWNSANTFAGGCSGTGTISCTKIPAAFRDGSGDQWFQYQVQLVGGTATPTFSDAIFSYDTVAPAGVTLNKYSGLSTSEDLTSDSFSVVLDSDPGVGKTVTISISATPSSEVTFSQAVINFNDSDWNNPVVINVTGANDDIDDGDINYTVSVDASSDNPDYNALATAEVTGSNIDNDTAGITITAASSLSTSETESTDSFTVVLDSEPTADVLIPISSSNSTEVLASVHSLTFTPSNWSTSQTVTVTGVDDNSDDGDVNFTILIGDALSGDSVYYGMVSSHLSGVNADNDSKSVILTPNSGLVTTEAGGTAEFTVALGAPAGSSVTLNFASNDTSEGTISPSSVTFFGSQWNSPKTIVITGVDETIDDGDIPYGIEVTLSSVDPDYSALVIPDVTVTNNDDDGPGGDPSFSQIAWGTTPPGNSVTCGQASGTWINGVCTANNTNNQAGWDSYAELDSGIEAANNNSDLELPQQTRVLTHTSASDFNPYIDNVVTDTTDSDFSTGATLGNTVVAGHSVALNSTLTGDIQSRAIIIGTHAGFSTLEFSSTIVDGTTLTIELQAADNANFDSNQTSWMTFHHGENISALGTRSHVRYRASFTSDSTSYSASLDDISIRYNTQLTISGDIESHRDRLSLKASSRSISWGAATSIYIGSMGSHGSSPVIGDFDSDGDIDFFVIDHWGSTALGWRNNGNNTFVTMPGWHINTGLGAGWQTGNAGDLDGDGDPEIILNSRVYRNDGLDNEGNLIWVYDTSISFIGGDLEDIDQDGDQDVFKNNGGGGSSYMEGWENHGAGSPVWVRNGDWDESDSWAWIPFARLADLDGDGDPEMYEMTDGYFWRNDDIGDGKPVWVLDAAGTWLPPNAGHFDTADTNGDDLPDAFTGNGGDYVYYSLNTTTVTYPGTTTTYDSRVLDFGGHAGFGTLDYNSSELNNSSLSISVRAGNTETNPDGWPQQWGVVSNGGDLSGFDAYRYLQYRVVLNAGDGNNTSPILNDITFNYTSRAVSDSIISTVYDTESANSLVTGLAWGETLPAGTEVHVQLRAAADNGGEPGAWSEWVGPDGLSGSYWDSTNTYAGGCSGTGAISCSVIPEALRNGVSNQWLQYKATLVSSNDQTPTLHDLRLSYVAGSATNISVSTTTRTTAESGTSQAFSVSLTGAAPTSNVDIHLAVSDPSEGYLSTTQLTFTPGDWAAKPVTVYGVDDSTDDGDVSYTIYLSAAESADNNYDNHVVSDVIVTNGDDETGGAGFTVSQTIGLVTSEDGVTTANFNVTPLTAPSANVTVIVTPDDTTEGTLSTNILTFPSGSTASQPVTVTGVQDLIFDNDVTYTVVLNPATSTDLNYDGLDPDDVTVTNTDDETADIVVSGGPFITSESGGMDLVYVKLSAQPAANVSVDFSVDDGSEARVFPTSLTFGSSNWNVDQWVILYGRNDASADGAVGFNLITSPFESTDSSFDGIDPQDIAASNSDDDSIGGVTVTASSTLETTEDGGVATFVIKLGAKPANDVIFTLTSTKPEEGYVPTTVILRPDDNSWYGTVVTVTGVDDMADDVDQAYTINGTVVSDDANYNGAAFTPINLTNISTNHSFVEQDLAGANLGRSVTFVDLNADGHDEMLIGMPGHATNTGRVEVFQGTGGVYSSYPSDVLSGPHSNSYFGYSLANAGDINNDGYEDLIVGAYGYTNGEANEGAIFIYKGTAQGVSTSYTHLIESDSANAKFGFSVAAAGQVNSDAYDDVIVGAPGYSSNLGRAEVYYGTSTITSISMGWVQNGTDASGQFGFSVGGNGDVDGANFDDIIIGAPYSSNVATNGGRAYVYLSQAGGGLSASSDWDQSGDVNAASYGFSVDIDGNINGDSYDDVLVGAPGYDNGQPGEGWVFVYHGGSGGPSVIKDMNLEGDQDNAEFGTVVMHSGDITGDSYGDVLISALKYDNVETDEGRLYVYKGASGGVYGSAVRTHESDQASSNYGISIAANDFNHDGYVDYITGADFYDNPETDEGRVFVYRTVPENRAINIVPNGTMQTSERGTTVSATLSLNAPPVGEVIVTLVSNDLTEGSLGSSVYSFTPYNWNSTRTILISGVDDVLEDGAVTYTITPIVTSLLDADYNGMAVADITVTNIDDDTTVTVAATDANAAESGVESGTFTLTRSNTQGDMAVNYQMQGDALEGTDYNALSGTVTFADGSTTTTVTLIPINDFYDESSESADLVITSSVNYVVGTPSAASVLIADDDTAGVTVSPDSGLITSEVGGSDTFTMRLDSKPTSNVTVSVSSLDSSEGLVLPSTPLTFTPSNWSNTQTVTVIGQDDNSIDGNIPYFIQTSATSSTDNLYNGRAVADVSVTNQDDETLPNVSVIATTANIIENVASPGVFTISRTGVTTSELTVYYSVSGSATSGDDFTALSGNLVLGIGVSSDTVNIAPLNDPDLEDNESVVFTISQNVNYFIDQPGAATVIIADDDQPTLPVANFALDQVAGDGSTVTVEVLLSDVAPAYPVSIPYTVGGDAVYTSDHNAASSTLVITSPNISGSFTFDVVDDGLGDSGEQVIFTMGVPTNVDAGTTTVHTVTIIENNEKPSVELVSVQGGLASRLIVAGDGNVTVTATVDDPNPSDTHSYDWSATNNSLTDIFDADDTTFVFDPVALIPGFYAVRLTATDSGTGSLAGTVELLLEIVSSAPTLNTVDSDGDGVTDDVESFDDTDADGIPDYLDDAGLMSNELQMLVAEGDSYIMRAQAGLVLSLGEVAFAAGSDGAIVYVDEIADYGAGEGNSGTAEAQDSVPITGDYVDFEVTGLPQAGQSVSVVVPQTAMLPISAVYRKYDPDTGWRDFVVDGNNAIASAAGTPGECPLPGDAAFTEGLTAGHYCVQLTIEDGGPNDTDGIANHVVQDPGEIITEATDEPTVVVDEPTVVADEPVTAKDEPTDARFGGSGALFFEWLLLILAYIMFRPPNVRRVRSTNES